MRLLLQARQREHRTMQIETSSQIKAPKRPKLFEFDRQYHRALLSYYEQKTQWWDAEAKKLRKKLAIERKDMEVGWEARIRVLDKKERKAEARAEEFKVRSQKQQGYLDRLDVMWDGAEEHANWIEHNLPND